jgi:Calx-beta domain-containing protein/centrosomal CEP192-like protein
MRRVLSIFLPVLAFFFLIHAKTANSATITVTSLADPGTAGTCTLRQAISVLNASSVAGTSCVNSGAAFGTSDIIDFDAALTGTITLGSTLTTPAAAKNYTINAPTLAITVNGNGNRIFNLTTSATLSVSGLTFTGGNSANGGAFDVSSGTLTISNSALFGNTTTGSGGALRNNGGTVTIKNSTISGNSSLGDGGGIRNTTGTMTLNNVTVTKNSTTGVLGGNDGGGISIGGGTVTLSNTIVAGNSVVTAIIGTNNGPDCNGTLTSAGYNLVGDTSGGCTFTPGTGDLTNVDAQLGGLQNNGGNTATHALSNISPALNAGNPATPAGAPTCETTDQRGTARPQLGTCDIGAYELTAAQLPGTLEFSEPSYSVNEGTGTVQVTLTVNRVNGSKGQVSVDYGTTDGTALNGTNYTTTSATLTFADGDTTPKTFTVDILDDPNAEGTTSFFVSLNNLTGGATFGGPSQAEVFIFDNDAADLAFDSGTTSFGPVAVGSSAGPNTLTLINNGNVDVVIGQADMIGTNAGSFVISSDTCSNATVVPSATCTFDLTFNAGIVGSSTAQVRFPSTSPSSPLLVAVTGTGTANAVATTTPADGSTLAFGNISKGTTSAPQTVELRNTGTTVLTLGSPGVQINGGGEFNLLLNTCSDNLELNPGDTCLVQVDFSPTSTSAQPATTLDFDSDGGTSSLDLTGQGQFGPLAVATPDSLDFGTLPPGQPSIPLQVELRNTGTEPLTLGADAALTTATAFQILTNSCVNNLVLNPGNHCVVVLQYTPPGPGNTSDSDTLTFTDNDGGTPGSTQTVDLTGAGQVGPIATTNPTSLDFGTLVPGQTSDPFQVELRNTGTTPLTLSADAALTTGTAFQIKTNTCVSNLVLNSGNHCVVVLQYTPPGPGNTSDSDTLTFTDDNGGVANSTQTVSLTGTGQVGPILTTNPVDGTDVSFGSHVVGQSGGLQVIQVINTGTTTLTLNTPSFTQTGSGDFDVLSNNCTDGLTLEPHEDCIMIVGYQPSTVGGANGEIVFSGDGGTSTIDFNGTGTAPGVGVNHTSLAFGSQILGTVSASQSVTVTNTGNNPLKIDSLSVVGANPADFSVASDNCSTVASIAPAATCTFSADFSPTALGARSASIKINSNSPSGAVFVALTGTGVAAPAPGTALANPDVTSLVFDPQALNTSSAPQAVTLTNGGTIPLQVSSVLLTGANPSDFAIASDGCSGVPIAPGATCTFAVVSSPHTQGNRTANVTITSNATNSPTLVALNGSGVAPSSGGGGCSLSSSGPITGSFMNLVVALFGIGLLGITRRRIS